MQHITDGDSPEIWLSKAEMLRLVIMAKKEKRLDKLYDAKWDPGFCPLLLALNKALANLLWIISTLFLELSAPTVKAKATPCC